MKKKISILTALLLAACLVFAGCSEEKAVSGEITPQQTTEPQLAEKELSVGRIEGGVYTNAYAGFGCALDSNWTYYSAEELQEMPEDVQSLVEGSELSEDMQKYAQIFDMQAENVAELTGVNVVYTKIGMQERLAYALLDESDEIDAMLESKDSMIEAYAQGGITVQSMEKVKVTFLGQEHYALYTVAQVEGIPYYMTQLLNYDIGAYGVTITASSFVEDKTADVLDLFYVVE